MHDPTPQPGWILHHRRYRETSLLVDAFTLGQGRVPLIARGAVGPRSRDRALYQPFRPLLLAWRGARGLRNLVSIEDSGRAFAFDNRRLGCAYYLNELLLRLVGEDEPQATLFAEYGLALEGLASSDDVEPPLRRFEMRLLDTLGLLPDLADCTVDGAALEDRLPYRFDPRAMLARPASADAGAGGTRGPKPRLPGDPPPVGETARRASGTSAVHDPGHVGAGAAHDDRETVLLHGATLRALAHGQLESPEVLREGKRLLRRIIEEQLGGRPLRSRMVFDALNPSARSSAMPGADADGTADRSAPDAADDDDARAGDVTGA